MDDSLKIQIVIAISAIVTTYLTVRYKDVVVKKARVTAPKDRMEQIFEGYEKLIVQQQEDIERKTAIITGLENIVAKLREDLDKTTLLLETARAEVRESRKQNNEMRKQLDSLRGNYRNDKKRVIRH